jgi:hypothetical protein
MPAGKLNMERHTKRTPPTPEQIKAEQKRQADADAAQIQANLPAVAPTPQLPAVMEPALNNADEYLARNPSMIIGRATHPNAKDGTIYYNDDNTEVSTETIWTVITDGIWVGRVRLVEGEPANMTAAYSLPPIGTVGPAKSLVTSTRRCGRSTGSTAARKTTRGKKPPISRWRTAPAAK